MVLPPLLKSVLFLVSVYCVIVALIYAAQRNLQYFPGKDRPGKPADYGVAEMQELKVKTEDGLELLAWFAPPKEKDGRIIVFYHGNAGDIGDRAHKARRFMDAGYGVYLCEYRRYGGNPGEISEDGFYKDARAGLNWLNDQGYKRSQWVIYGESIGTGVAVQMAQEFQPKWLVLEAPFSSIVDAASRQYFWLPLSRLLKDRYDNLAKIKSVQSNILILHGTADEVIPAALGQKLYDAANNPKHLALVKGAHHNDLYDHRAGDLVLSWLKAHE